MQSHNTYTNLRRDNNMTSIIAVILQLYSFAIIIRVLSSWINIDRSNNFLNQAMTFIYDITEPVLAPVRNALPPTAGMDFSPLIVLLLISVVERLLF